MYNRTVQIWIRFMMNQHCKNKTYLYRFKFKISQTICTHLGPNVT